MVCVRNAKRLAPVAVRTLCRSTTREGWSASTAPSRRCATTTRVAISTTQPQEKCRKSHEQGIMARASVCHRVKVSNGERGHRSVVATPSCGYTSSWPGDQSRHAILVTFCQGEKTLRIFSPRQTGPAQSKFEQNEQHLLPHSRRVTHTTRHSWCATNQMTHLGRYSSAPRCRTLYNMPQAPASQRAGQARDAAFRQLNAALRYCSSGNSQLHDFHDMARSGTPRQAPRQHKRDTNTLHREVLVGNECYLRKGSRYLPYPGHQKQALQAESDCTETKQRDRSQQQQQQRGGDSVSRSCPSCTTRNLRVDGARPSSGPSDAAHGDQRA